MGMVNYAVADDQFNEAVDKLIKEIKHCSPLIIRLNKRAVKQHLGMPFAQALASVSDLFLNTLMKTEDVPSNSTWECRLPRPWQVSAIFS